MDARLDALLNPSFAKDPPVKLNISAKTLGGVYAILGAIAALFGFFGLLTILGIGSYFAYIAAASGLVLLYALGSFISLIGTAVTAWGGYRMYQGDRDGKRLAIYGLAVVAVGSLVSALGTLAFGGWIVTLAFIFVCYYLVIISRFEGEPKLAP